MHAAASNGKHSLEVVVSSLAQMFHRLSFVLPSFLSLSSHGESLLHFAVMGANNLLVQSLVDLGCNLDVTDYSGQMPIHIAIEDGRTRCVQSEATVFVSTK